MILHTSPYRLVLLPGVIVLAWPLVLRRLVLCGTVLDCPVQRLSAGPKDSGLLVLAGVLPADAAASVSLIVILYALAPVGRWFGQGQD